MAYNIANAAAKVVNLAGGTVAAGVDIEGGYFSIDSLSNIPDHAKVEGTLCYCIGDGKFYQYNGSTWVEKKLVPVFIGTTSEYEAQKDTIPEGAIVIITDDNDSVADSTSSILGTGVLGYMILG